MNIYIDAPTKEKAIEDLKAIEISEEDISAGTLQRLSHLEELWCFIPKEKENQD